MQLLNLLEDTLNEMPDGLNVDQRKEWMKVQIDIFSRIAKRNGWEYNSSEYIKNLFLFGKIFADRYDGNFNKIHSIEKEAVVEMEKVLLTSLKERLVR